MAKLEERIAAAEERLKKLKAEQQRKEAQKRALEAKQKRSQETRELLLIGAVVKGRLKRGLWPEDKFRKMLDEDLTREHDRAVFGLPPKAPPPGKEEPHGEL
jgi:chromosome segregation ATPase